MRAALILLLAACDRDPFQPLEPVQARVEILDLPSERPHTLDLLFVVDDSPAMAPFVDNLALNAPNFANVLSTIPGGLPDLRVGVISADPADAGALRRIDNASWLEARAYPDGSRSLNVSGTFGDAFTRMFALGASGSAVAQPLAMARQALLDAPSFLRDDADLAIVFISAQDDHSAVAIADAAAWFHAAKRDPNDIRIAAIAGFGCAAVEDATRLAAFAAEFPNREATTTICQRDLSDGLTIYSELLSTHFVDPCFGSKIDPTTCVASDRLGERDATVPVCAGTLAFPCFEIVPDPVNCALTPTESKASVRRRDWAPEGTHTLVECTVID